MIWCHIHPIHNTLDHRPLRVLIISVADDFEIISAKNIKYLHKWEFNNWIELKTLWLKGKLLIMSNFPFCHNVFKSRLQHLRRNASASGKGLTVPHIHKLSEVSAADGIQNHRRGLRRKLLTISLLPHYFQLYIIIFVWYKFFKLFTECHRTRLVQISCIIKLIKNLIPLTVAGI